MARAPGCTSTHAAIRCRRTTSEQQDGEAALEESWCPGRIATDVSTRRCCDSSRGRLLKRLVPGTLFTVVMVLSLALAAGATATTAQSGSLGIMTPTYIRSVRSDVSLGVEPWASAWAHFEYDLPSALSATPRYFVGPALDASGSIGALQRRLDRDGSYARNLAIGYAISRKAKYAAKARTFLLAWARHNHPTTKTYDCDTWGGSYASHGYFCFAYAYDLTKASGVYSAADKVTIRAYFKRASRALATYLDWWYASDWVFRHPDHWIAYDWTSNPQGLAYDVYDAYIGNDNTVLTSVARLALAIEAGDGTTVSKLFDPKYVFSVQSILDHGCQPRNDGDGVLGHPIPVPTMAIYMPGLLDNPEHGGCIDYMTYNARAHSILLLMAQAQGVQITLQLAELHVTWDYLRRFFGTAAEPSPANNDVIALQTDLSRFVIALHLFPTDGDLLNAAKSGNTSSYEEPQFLGPTTLTLWPLGP